MKTGVALCILFFFPAVISAQDLSGEWYSADSSRVYNVFHTGDQYQATLIASSHAGDRLNGFILKEVIYNEKKKCYEGIILSPIDGLATTAKIRFSEKDPDVLRLRLHRMLVNVNIEWRRKKTA